MGTKNWPISIPFAACMLPFHTIIWGIWGFKNWFITFFVSTPIHYTFLTLGKFQSFQSAEKTMPWCPVSRVTQYTIKGHRGKGLEYRLLQPQAAWEDIHSCTLERQSGLYLPLPRIFEIIWVGHYCARTMNFLWVCFFSAHQKVGKVFLTAKLWAHKLALCCLAFVSYFRILWNWRAK